MRGRKTPWRDNIEALSMAIIMALLLKYFIIEAYKIPTGSMQPTLIGDERTDVFDRILVDKLSFRFRDPKRFEVVVFRYPLDRSKNFVKRIVGIGPEHVMIRDGDIWRRDDASAPWEILRRPRKVQEETWKRIDRLDPETGSWRPHSGGSAWTFEGRRIEARGDGKARFGELSAIMDVYTHGYPDVLVDEIGVKKTHGVHPVGDVRVDFEVTALPGTRSVAIELWEGVNRYLFRIPGPAADPDERPTVTGTAHRVYDQVEEIGLAVAETPFRLPAQGMVRIAAQNLDDLVELDIDGEIVCSLEIQGARDQRAMAYVLIEGEGADFDDVMVYRDIYYTAGKENHYAIPEGHYFMLGDNTQDSSDSRDWVFERFQTEDGSDEMVILRGNRRDDSDPFQRNPSPVGIGNPEGMMWRFKDEWGEVHWFDGRRKPLANPAIEAAPFVPRHLMRGRALAVFWPQMPQRDLYRLKWVR